MSGGVAIAAYIKLPTVDLYAVGLTLHLPVSFTLIPAGVAVVMASCSPHFYEVEHIVLLVKPLSVLILVPFNTNLKIVMEFPYIILSLTMKAV